ncbi:unnamed protein product [Adineta steineri]|uniref:Malonyl-CoA:ACP transacylase (MAT) domain-containing protein n=1 Tax=Adineta steineri TaxID=433720 RepID=A0A819H888_9BILA|nr:unnamed protein product [Adineta steineri]CAF3893002.1 unnamed protein product [Adineta steineri]CAF4019753.1 unnamed protein product [Adineta steineri]
MAINVTNKMLLFASFGNVNLSQRLRALYSTTNNQNTKTYDGSLILQIGSTSLSLKETLSTSTDNLPSTNIPTIHPSSSNSTSSNRQISVLDIIVGKSQALTSLQPRGIYSILSGVTNIRTIVTDVPLRSQDVHDLVNRTGRLITFYVQQFLPNDKQQTSLIQTTTNTDNELINTSLNHTIEELHILISLEQTTKKCLDTRRKDPIIRNINSHPLETQQNISASSKRPIFEVHVIAHCQKMIFFITILSTLKAQYKIAVANISGMKSRYTIVIHEHVLHFLNNNNHDHQQSPIVSSDNHVRIDFPVIRCYGNYSIQQEQENKTKDHLNLRTKIGLWIQLIDAEMTKNNNGEWRLLEELIGKTSEDESRINDTNIAQPALFAIQVALAALLVSWNIYPSTIVSHNAGDQAAASVAARLTLQEAVRIVYHRSRLENRNTRQGGRMLAVSMSEGEVQNKLLKGIEHLASTAVVNNPHSVTISGDEKIIDELQQTLSTFHPNIFKARLRIENAFYSYQMNRFDIEKDVIIIKKYS